MQGGRRLGSCSEACLDPETGDGDLVTYGSAQSVEVQVKYDPSGAQIVVTSEA